ncbi:hypothetical protein [Vulcanococcus sp.]
MTNNNLHRPERWCYSQQHPIDRVGVRVATDQFNHHSLWAVSS